MPNEFLSLITYVLSIVIFVGIWQGFQKRYSFIKKINIVEQFSFNQENLIRFGSVFIVSSYLITLIIILSILKFGSLNNLLNSDTLFKLKMIIFGGLVFFCIGLVEDVLDFPPLKFLNNLFKNSHFYERRKFLQNIWLRIIIQIIFITAWTIQAKVPMKNILFFSGLPNFIGAIITAFWLVFIVNIFKRIDKQDGLGYGTASITSIVLLMVSLVITIGDPFNIINSAEPKILTSLISAALSGSMLVISYYNFEAKKCILIGSSGVYFIGFTLASTGMIELIKTITFAAIILPYIILSCPFFDIPVKMITEIRRVTLQRLRQKQFPFTQDKRYLVNRQLRSGFSQRITILFIYALILLLGGLMLAILIFYSKANVISIITSFIYILGGIWLLCYLILKVKKLSN